MGGSDTVNDPEQAVAAAAAAAGPFTSAHGGPGPVTHAVFTAVCAQPRRHKHASVKAAGDQRRPRFTRRPAHVKEIERSPHRDCAQLAERHPKRVLSVHRLG
ncbi:hypothetical protein AAFF_G00167250 [Aldrovandia affinis]|uniref:Uncharacterized protein n=1 Tax=Aldrovandia affinis TaxID=143900 RepID=A0AAD7RM10_9TELE|nr:hypothetical protein AAFF_G00167250 [Aldrovandia affinis]